MRGQELIEKLNLIDSLLDDIINNQLVKEDNTDISSKETSLENETTEVLQKAKWEEEQFDRLVKIYRDAKGKIEKLNLKDSDSSVKEKRKLKKYIEKTADELEKKEKAIDNEKLDKQKVLKAKKVAKEKNEKEKKEKKEIIDEIPRVRKANKKKITKFCKKRDKVIQFEAKYKPQKGESIQDAMQRRKRTLEERLYGKDGTKDNPKEGSLYYKYNERKKEYDKVWKQNVAVIKKLDNPFSLEGIFNRSELRRESTDLILRLRSFKIDDLKEEIRAEEECLVNTDNDINNFSQYTEQVKEMDEAKQELINDIKSGEWTDATKKYLSTCDNNELAIVLGGDIQKSELRKNAKKLAGEAVRLSSEINLLQLGMQEPQTENLGKQQTRTENLQKRTYNQGTSTQKKSEVDNKDKNRKQDEEIDNEKEEFWNLMTKDERREEIEKFLLGGKTGWFAKAWTKVRIFISGGAERFHKDYVRKDKIDIQKSQAQWKDVERKFKGEIACAVSKQKGDNVKVSEQQRDKAYEVVGR